jgi:hypothetical protein
LTGKYVGVSLQTIRGSHCPWLPGRKARHVEATACAEACSLRVDDGELVIIGVHVVKNAILARAFVVLQARRTVAQRCIAEAVPTAPSRAFVLIVHAINALVTIDGDNPAELTSGAALDAADAGVWIRLGQHAISALALPIRIATLAVASQCRCLTGSTGKACAGAVTSEGARCAAIDAASAVETRGRGARIEVVLTDSALEPCIRAITTGAVHAIDAAATVRTGCGRAIVDVAFALGALEPSTSAVTRHTPYAVDATTSIEAGRRRTIVDVAFAARTTEPGPRAVAREAVHTVLTRPSVEAGRRGAVVDVSLAPSTAEAGLATIAREAVDAILTDATVRARAGGAVVDVSLTPGATEAQLASAAEAVHAIGACATV